MEFFCIHIIIFSTYHSGDEETAENVFICTRVFNIYMNQCKVFRRNKNNILI